MADLQDVTAKYRDIDETLLMDRDSDDRKDALAKGVKWAAFVDTYITKEVSTLRSFFAHQFAGATIDPRV